MAKPQQHGGTGTQQTNMTCPCGSRGNASITAELKSGTRQAYCCEECREDDQPRQKQQQT